MFYKKKYSLEEYQKFFFNEEEPSSDKNIFGTPLGKQYVTKGDNDERKVLDSAVRYGKAIFITVYDSNKNSVKVAGTVTKFSDDEYRVKIVHSVKTSVKSGTISLNVNKILNIMVMGNYALHINMTVKGININK